MSNTTTGTRKFGEIIGLIPLAGGGVGYFLYFELAGNKTYEINYSVDGGATWLDGGPLHVAPGMTVWSATDTTPGVVFSLLET